MICTMSSQKIKGTPCSIYHDNLALWPGSSQFFNVVRRKTREPGKIYHMRDVG